MDEVIIMDELPVLAAAADEEVIWAAPLEEATTADEEAETAEEAPAA